MKIKLSFFVLFFCLQNLCAQVLIEPMVGLRSLKTVGSFRNHTGLCDEFDFSKILNKKNYLVGINLGFQISNRLLLNSAFNYSKGAEKYCDKGIVGWSLLKFENLNWTLLPEYKYKGFKIGFGLNYQLLKDIHKGKTSDPNINGDNQGNRQQLGWISSFSYQFEPVSIAIRYSETSNIEPEKNDVILNTKSVELIFGFPIFLSKP